MNNVLGNEEYIMDLLDWRNSPEIQKKGIMLAQGEKDISIFLQPNYLTYNKNVWENCAIIISNKTDEELTQYIFELLNWIQDLNWPGACRIFDRLNRFSDKICLDSALRICIEMAQKTGDDIWENNLKEILIHN